MINKTLVGKRISLLRQSKGWSQIYLAEKLGVTSQAVSKWEYEYSLPNKDRITYFLLIQS